MKVNYINTNKIFESKETKIIETISKWFLIFCILITGCLTYLQVVYETAPVEGISMQNTLNQYGDRMYDTVVINIFMKYSYGDIIVIDRTTKNDFTKTFHVKRVVGLEGDVINFVEIDGSYYLQRNGKIIEENYVKSKGGNYTTYQNFHNILRRKEAFLQYFDENDNLTLPKGSVFVLGDNRGNSEDGSKFGFYSKNDVVGKVQYVVPHGVSVFEYFIKNLFRLPIETYELYKNV